MRKAFFLLLGFFLSSPILAASQSTIPGWLQRTSIGLDLQAHYPPEYIAQTIQPIFQTKDNTFFWQGNVSHAGSDETYNLGVGYRYLLDSKNWMWGINTFFDKTNEYNHQRIGLGGELFGKYVTFRANYYDAITHKHDTQTLSGITYYEKALSGYDYGVELPVPYLRWANVTATGYHWDGKSADDLNGYEVGVRATPISHLETEVGVDKALGNAAEIYCNISFNFGAPASIEYTATQSNYPKPQVKQIFTPHDLKTQRLAKTKRHNDTAVEETNSSNNDTKIVARQ